MERADLVTHEARKRKPKHGTPCNGCGWCRMVRRFSAPIFHDRLATGLSERQSGKKRSRECALRRWTQRACDEGRLKFAGLC
jgi:hypothetical protein